MLLVLIAVGGATIDAEKDKVFGNGIYVNATGWVGAAGWVIFVAGVTLITEFIMLLLHFLNPSHFNNSYGIFGGLVRKFTPLFAMMISYHLFAGYCQMCHGWHWSVHWVLYYWSAN